VLEAPVEETTRKGISIGARAIGMKERELRKGSNQPVAQQLVHASVRAGMEELGPRSVLLHTSLTTPMDLVICCRGRAEEALA